MEVKTHQICFLLKLPSNMLNVISTENFVIMTASGRVLFRKETISEASISQESDIKAVMKGKGLEERQMMTRALNALKENPSISTSVRREEIPCEDKPMICNSGYQPTH